MRCRVTRVGLRKLDGSHLASKISCMRFQAFIQFVRPAMLYGLVVGVIIPLSIGLWAEQIPVVHTEGTVHGFLVLRTLDGKVLASGDLIEVTRGDRVSSRLVFHFRDGSIDDERAVYHQRRTFSLVSDRHVQKGPAFTHSMDMLVDVPAGTVTVRSCDGGKEKVETQHMDLPLDLVNGMTLTILKNISPHTVQTMVSYVAATPKPRIVKLAISPDGEDTFSVAGVRHKATRYVARVELGGLTGVIAPLIGKQPPNTKIWVVGGEAPAFVKSEGPFSEGGAIWSIAMTSPTWPRTSTTRKGAPGSK